MDARITRTQRPGAQNIPLAVLDAAKFKKDIERNRVEEIWRSENWVIAPPPGTNVDDKPLRIQSQHVLF